MTTISRKHLNASTNLHPSVRARFIPYPSPMNWSRKIRPSSIERWVKLNGSARPVSRNVFDGWSTKFANKLIFKRILADSWFSSADNFPYIASLEQQFILPLKSNRKVALSKADQKQGRYQPIESLAIEAHQCLAVWVAWVTFHPLSDQADCQRRRHWGDTLPSNR